MTYRVLLFGACENLSTHGRYGCTPIGAVMSGDTMDQLTGASGVQTHVEKEKYYWKNNIMKNRSLVVFRVLWSCSRVSIEEWVLR